MSDYSVQTWTNGVSVANASRMTNIENGIAAVPGVYFLTTPYLFASNVTITNGSTNNYTIVGNGTPAVPSGAKAALVSCYWVGSTAGTFLQMVAHGQSVAQASNWPLLGQAQVNSGQVVGFGIVPLDGTGKLDAQAQGGGNVTGLYASVFGYVH